MMILAAVLQLRRDTPVRL